METTIAQISFLLAAALIAGVGAYFGSYLKEKGKGLATKEDIARVTEIAEQIRAQYASGLEQVKSNHQLRVAAIDRRLAAHQEAFALWRRLNQHLDAEDLHVIVTECNDWWTANCLYLEPDARQAFSDAYWGASMYRQLRRTQDINPTHDIGPIVLERLNTIIEAGNRIAKAVELPGLSTLELERTKQTP
jgi:hypothetical protein